MSTKSQAVEGPGPKDETKKALQEAAKKLMVLCTPWPSWVVSGCWIIGTPHPPAASTITATDIAGREILSYVPLPIVADFLSKPGQSVVSCLFYILSIFTNYLNDLR